MLLHILKSSLISLGSSMNYLRRAAAIFKGNTLHCETRVEETIMFAFGFRKRVQKFQCALISHVGVYAEQALVPAHNEHV